MKVIASLPLFAFIATAAAEISEGYYQIRTLTDGRPYLGRQAIEQKTVLPKPIVARSEPDDPWRVEQISEGVYRLYSRGIAVGVLQGWLYAFFDEDDAATWVIKPVPDAGDDIYIVETSSLDAKWVAPDGPDGDLDYSQVLVSDKPSDSAPVLFHFGREED